jgi:hypothetical protein
VCEVTLLLGHVTVGLTTSTRPHKVYVSSRNNTAAHDLVYFFCNFLLLTCQSTTVATLTLRQKNCAVKQIRRKLFITIMHKSLYPLHEISQLMTAILPLLYIYTTRPIQITFQFAKRGVQRRSTVPKS